MNFISRTVHQILKSFKPKNCKFFSLFLWFFPIFLKPNFHVHVCVCVYHVQYMYTTCKIHTAHLRNNGFTNIPSSSSSSSSSLSFRPPSIEPCRRNVFLLCITLSKMCEVYGTITDKRDRSCGGWSSGCGREGCILGSPEANEVLSASISSSSLKKCFVWTQTSWCEYRE